MHGQNGYLLKRGLVCRPVVLAPASFLLILFLCVARVNAASNPQSSLAINLSAVQDYSDEDPFVDYFKMSREWIPQCEVGVDAGCTWNNAWDTGEQSQIQVDANGWVKKLPLSGDSPLFRRVSTLMMVAGDTALLDLRWQGGEFQHDLVHMPTCSSQRPSHVSSWRILV